MVPMLWLTAYMAVAVLTAILLNVVYQLFFRLWNRTEPPMVFHWVPYLGSTISYGIDPYKFFFACREKASFKIVV